MRLRSIGCPVVPDTASAMSGAPRRETALGLPFQTSAALTMTDRLPGSASGPRLASERGETDG